MAGGLPPGPFIKEVYDTGTDSAETLDILAYSTPDGSGRIIRDGVVLGSTGMTLASYAQGVTASFGASAAAVLAEQTARTSADTAEAQNRLTLAAIVGQNSSAINANYIALTSADSTEATARLALDSRFQGFQSSASQQLVTLASNDQAFSASLTSLNSDYGGFKAGANSQLATLSNQTSALATSTSSLTAQYGSLSASVSVNAGAIATLQGRTSAYFYVSATAPGGQALLALAADGYGSNVLLSAGRIWFGQYTYYEDATRTLQTRYNGRAKVIGSGFGSAGQFMEWSGPDVPLASMTESNALYYEKIDGSGFFAGGVTSGTTQATGAYSGSSVPAAVQTTLLTKRGGSVKIDVFFSIFLLTQKNGADQGDVSYVPSILLQVQGSYDGQNWGNVGGQVQFTGSQSNSYDTERSVNAIRGGINGSLIATDNVNDGGVYYRVVPSGLDTGGNSAPKNVAFTIVASNNRG